MVAVDGGEGCKCHGLELILPRIYSIPYALIRRTLVQNSVNILLFKFPGESAYGNSPCSVLSLNINRHQTYISSH